MIKKAHRYCLACLAAFIAIYALGYLAVEKKRQGLMLHYASPQSLISGSLGQWVAGEFKGVLADYLLLEAGSFIGSNQKDRADDWQNIYLTLRQALVLDPFFKQSYIYAQGNLPWEAGMVTETIELLSIAQNHRFWDWMPGYYAGFNYYYFLNDFASAADRFLEAAKVKDSPVLLPILGGRLAMKGRNTEAGIALLQSMVDNQELEGERLEEIQWRIAALKGVVMLEKAIGRHREAFDANPDNLNQLVEKGFLQELPENPYNEAYQYNAQTGRVAFDKVK